MAGEASLSRARRRRATPRSRCSLPPSSAGTGTGSSPRRHPRGPGGVNAGSGGTAGSAAVYAKSRSPPYSRPPATKRRKSVRNAGWSCKSSRITKSITGMECTHAWQFLFCGFVYVYGSCFELTFASCIHFFPTTKISSAKKTSIRNSTVRFELECYTYGRVSFARNY